MTRPPVLRRATPEDADAIADIVRGLAGENVGLRGEFTVDRAREWLRRRRWAATGLVAPEDGEACL